MWGLTSVPSKYAKKNRHHLTGHAAAGGEDKSGRSSAGRDEAVVVQASGIAPLPHLQLHLHGAGGPSAATVRPDGAAAGASGGAGSSAGGGGSSPGLMQQQHHHHHQVHIGHSPARCEGLPYSEAAAAAVGGPGAGAGVGGPPLGDLPGSGLCIEEGGGRLGLGLGQVQVQGLDGLAGPLGGVAPSPPLGQPYQRPGHGHNAAAAAAGPGLLPGSAIGAGLPGSAAAAAAAAAAGGGGVSSVSLGSLDAELVRGAALSTARRGQLCDSGLPDPDMCDLTDESGPPAAMPVVEEALSRGRWLLGLLIVQSTSSFVLDAYQELLRDHLVVTLFLTMLVGAGGNAGNQSAIKVIRGLATGVIRPSWPSARATMREQALVGVLLGTGLSAGGFLRVYATHGDVTNAVAISISLFLIVMTSVVLGTGLPFALARAGVDPANAGTSIQVLMDILGVAITCVTCNFVLVQLASGIATSSAAAAAAAAAGAL
ncbi:hypothetical protein HYH02_003028 [Chlamydomonas schloesseri]|uniref:SLC41A/MgtE integral membrane domain-containing protein n=1 Tax=Chlamydomonas schloesseri TaxID=2026947 RepID=A0A836BBC7_9CHLO|nr:hypothetical protein HYH02_003028 [Chlamydomonas schloesseri]|eukprot:KAG2452799.1 hypothetical protein HYH02_003028 [Chlamydomonas schloesseri]